MISNKTIAVVIPCYKVSTHIKTVIFSLPDFIDYIIVIDDACPEKSGAIAKNLNLEKVYVQYHEINQGVGGAVISGFEKAMALKCDIVVKLDGDGQMDPTNIGKLVQALIDGDADYTKGNRFNDFKALRSMPKMRLFGNSVLSFMVKAASGYWNIMDPTNGFCAITTKALGSINLQTIDKRYFFETDMLINLNLMDLVVKDVPISAIYKNEISSLSVSHSLFTFPLKIIKGVAKRIFFKYYVYNFNMASIYFFIAIPLLLFGFVLGIYKWRLGIIENEANNAGTIMLVALPIILGIQFLLQAISIDINNIPKKNP